MTHHKFNIHQRGFTLVEVAVTVVIVGIFVAAIVNLMSTRRDTELKAITDARMEKVLQRLSTFVDSRGRLPCPTNPSRTDNQFGWEWDFNLEATQDVARYVCSNTGNSQTADGNRFNDNNTIGVVPFLTLGLDVEDVKDGWGHYFTYAVSPVYSFDEMLARDNQWGTFFWILKYGAPMRDNDYTGANVVEPGVAVVPLSVSSQCRTYGWVRMLNDNDKNLTDQTTGGMNELNGNEGVLTGYDWRTTNAAAIAAIPDPRNMAANFQYRQIRRNVGLLKAKYCCSVIPTGATLPTQTASYQTATAFDGNLLMNYYGRSNGGPAVYAPATDLIMEVVNAAGVRSWTDTRPAIAETNYGDLGDSNGAGLQTNYPGANTFSYTVANRSVTAPAFALVSHGANGTGAYRVDGTFNRNGVPVGVSEQENADLDRIFAEGLEADATGNDTYDDIVVWMTQDNILAYNGSSSCGAP